MLNRLLQPQVVEFIKRQEKSTLKPADYDRLLFNKSKHPNIPMELVVDQLRARQKAKAKLPQWFQTDGIIMPPLLSMEQCSSEITAEYKSNLIQGNLAIDLTGGAGVDSYYLSKKFKQVIYVDFNKDLVEIAAHNFRLLGASNIEVVHANSEEYIANFKGVADCIYVDPARRNQDQKVFLFEDCSPNIVKIQPNLLQKAKMVLVKASPMLDITKGVSQLANVAEVVVVALKNEVKELLFIQKKANSPKTKVSAVDIAYDYSFTAELDSKEDVAVAEISIYLYEPAASILKIGKTDQLAVEFDLHKLNKNTNLYSSNLLRNDFPGRKFKVDKVLKYNKKQILAAIGTNQANIAVRNFTDTVEEFRKKIGLKPGGSVYLFGIRDIKNNLQVLVCSKI